LRPYGVIMEISLSLHPLVYLYTCNSMWTNIYGIWEWGILWAVV